jgi:hypothetical protein
LYPANGPSAIPVGAGVQPFASQLLSLLGVGSGIALARPSSAVAARMDVKDLMVNYILIGPRERCPEVRT